MCRRWHLHCKYTVQYIYAASTVIFINISFTFYENDEGYSFLRMQAQIIVESVRLLNSVTVAAYFCHYC